MASVIYTSIVTPLIIAALVWAVKSARFKHRVRARRLPLAEASVEA